MMSILFFSPPSTFSLWRRNMNPLNPQQSTLNHHLSPGVTPENVRQNEMMRASASSNCCLPRRSLGEGGQQDFDVMTSLMPANSFHSRDQFSAKSTPPQ